MHVQLVLGKPVLGKSLLDGDGLTANLTQGSEMKTFFLIVQVIKKVNMILVCIQRLLNGLRKTKF